MRRPPDPVARPQAADTTPVESGGNATLTGAQLDFMRALAERPHAHDLYQALRRIECLHPDKPRFGQALRPVDEPVRLAQAVAMSFAPAPIAAFEAGKGGAVPRIVQRIFGLLGPNGPLPLHLTDYTRERVIHHGDHTLARFLDLFHHRLGALFYRAWAQAQPTVNLDRPHDDRFAVWVGSLIGIGRPALRRRDAAGDHTKLHHAGILARQVKSAEGLRQLLANHFGLPVRIEQFIGHWMGLPQTQRTRLGTPSAQLGAGAVAGGRVWDRQHKFRVHFGPLSMAQYESLLPGRELLPRLLALVRQVLCFELDWDVRLAVATPQVAPARLGVQGRLGWTAWLSGVASVSPWERAGAGAGAAGAAVTGITLNAEAHTKVASSWPR